MPPPLAVSVHDAFCGTKGKVVWIPAFAGMTGFWGSAALFLQGPNRARELRRAKLSEPDGSRPAYERDKEKQPTKRDARLREHDGVGWGVGAALFPSRPEQGPLANASEAQRAGGSRPASEGFIKFRPEQGPLANASEAQRAGWLAPGV